MSELGLYMTGARGGDGDVGDEDGGDGDGGDGDGGDGDEEPAT